MPEQPTDSLTAAPGDPQTFHTPETTVRDYLRVVSTRRWLVIGVVALVFTLAGLYAFTRTPIYRSSALLQIAPERPSVEATRRLIEEAGLSAGARADFLETQMRLIVAERLIRQTYNHFHNEYGIGDKPPFVKARDPVGKFKDLFRVSPVRRTWLVNVTFDWPDAERGAAILDYHIRLYVRDYQERRHAFSSSLLNNLADLREGSGPKVREAHQKLQDFKRKHNMIAFDRLDDVVADELKQRREAVGESRRKLADAKAQLEQIQRAIADKTPLDNLPAVLQSRLIIDFRNQKLRVEQQLAEARKRFGENHPRIVELRATLESIDDSITKEIQRILQAVQQACAQAEAYHASCLAALDEQEQEVRRVNSLMVEYQQLKKDAEQADRLHSNLSRVIQQLEVQIRSNTGREAITIERSPKREVRPAKPRRALILGVAGFVGLALGVGLAFLLDGLDTSLKTKEDVARYLGLSVLGYVPELEEVSGSKRKHNRNAIAVARHPRSPVAEAFRSIRTALSFSVAAQNVRFLMVTSASPAEGKTLVSTNVAAALAQTGKRVLLVDADMRKPALHKNFELDNQRGLTSLLVEEDTAVVDVARQTEVENLSFISCGAIPPNPAELIGCERMRAVLQEMIDGYEYVVIDTPPVINVTDAAILAHTAHGVILVVRGFRTERDLARRAVEVLSAAGAKMLGVVLNNIDVPRGAYYYDGYYSYKKGYRYYAYGEEGGRRKRKRHKKRDAAPSTAEPKTTPAKPPAPPAGSS
jgi:capsular exopolysaccharide synthesis family protein